MSTQITFYERKNLRQKSMHALDHYPGVKTTLFNIDCLLMVINSRIIFHNTFLCSYYTRKSLKNPIFQFHIFKCVKYI